MDLHLPSYAKIPNGPHEPNVTPKGVMVVDEPYKMMKNLMKMAKPQVKLPTYKRGPTRSPRTARTARTHKKGNVKWY